MLRELHISNLAVISDARIELHPGLNCFTGATGAGKSLVIGALEVLLGMRSPAEMLRAGVDEGRVSGVFQVENKGQVADIERVTDVKIAEDAGEILLTRRLYASGRSSISLNGNPITLSMLKQVAESLVDVHGQHDQQYLLKPSNQLDVLDQFGGAWELRGEYREAFGKLQEARQRVADLAASRSLREQQLELYRFQAKEIDAAELDAKEYAELGARGSVLKNLEKLKKDASATYSALYEVDGAVLERLKMMSAVLGELSVLDQNLKNVAGGMRDATINLEEVAYDLSRYLDKLDLDPAESAEIEDRLNTINRILNKYRGTMDDTMAYRQEIGEKIAGMEKATDDLASLDALIPPLVKRVEKLGAELSVKRQGTAKKISPLVEKQLAELGMEKAKFTVSVTKMTEAGASGFDGVEFVVQTNPGLAPQPLRKIASGGEMSRIMLAIKGILALSDRVSVLVFDEIDANVGGRLGSVIGNKLRGLASHHQVLCITHLPQIACYGDRHLTVRKEVAGGKTNTSVRVMEGKERLEEIAEMIGGQRVTEVTRAQAAELLETARGEFREKKKKVKV
ncbi:MAG TPA: DNA repair protein RecN [Tepidisphaeraceae bacterium]|jgi:DNA repair protein RecN (Recombination protein N)|nr:DNA repair protein RecN [Tepidisphaeraceae bacterium]